MTPLADAPALERLQPEVAAAHGKLLALAPLQPDAAIASYRFSWQQLRGDATPLVIRLHAGDEAFDLGLQQPAHVPGLELALQPALPSALQRACLVQLAQPSLQALSLLLGARVTLESAHVAGNSAMPGAQASAIGFLVEPSSAALPWGGWVRPVQASGWRWLVGNAEKLMAPREPRTPALACHPVLGTASLSLRDLRELMPEDVVVIQRRLSAEDSLQCWLTLGDNRRAIGRAALQRSGLRVIHMQGHKETFMEDPVAAPAALPLDAIAVTVRFELPPWRASLTELQQLTPGSVIDLAQDLREAHISLWLDRQRIGNGSLVALGDRLGVRVRELRLEPPSTPAMPATAAGESA